MTIGKHRLGAAPWDEVFDYAELADDFMLRIFNATPYEFGITDRSSLGDFLGIEGDIAEVHAKIAKVYGVDVSAVPEGNILGILRLIANTR